MEAVVLNFKTINNINDPSAIDTFATRDSKGGELIAAMNVDLSLDGVATRRKGYVQTYSGNHHSLFSNGTSLWSVKSGVLCRNNANVFDLTSNSRMDYAVCSNGWIVFTNGTDIGYIEGGTPHFFGNPDMVFIDEAGNEVETFKEKLIAGKFVTYLNGMILVLAQIGDESWLIHTDAWDFDGYKADENYLRWKGAAQMLKAVDNGVWVGASDKVMYVSFGESDGEVEKANYAAVPYTSQVIKSEKIGIEGLSGSCVVFTTTQGICVGDSNGQFLNLSKTKISLPQANSGSAFIKESDGKTSYICNLLSNTAAYNPRDSRPLELDT